ncbi:MAG: hypothetical protein QM488_15175 [Rhizobiaceae bacterium]
MDKRKFLTLSATGLAFAGMKRTSASSRGKNIIEDAGVKFQWHHKDGRLFGTLSAPTAGWIAVGFNEVAGLNNMRFIMAAVSTMPIRAEDHLTQLRRHTDVKELGIATSLADVSGNWDGNDSTLSFSLSHIFEGRPSLTLSPYSKIHLMLAWSHETNFNHHSAWRRHYPITL